jgi:hypothetical protein
VSAASTPRSTGTGANCNTEEQETAGADGGPSLTPQLLQTARCVTDDHGTALLSASTASFRFSHSVGWLPTGRAMG